MENNGTIALLEYTVGQNKELEEMFGIGDSVINALPCVTVKMVGIAPVEEVEMVKRWAQMSQEEKDEMYKKTFRPGLDIIKYKDKEYYAYSWEWDSANNLMLGLQANEHYKSDIVEQWYFTDEVPGEGDCYKETIDSLLKENGYDEVEELEELDSKINFIGIRVEYPMADSEDFYLVEDFSKDRVKCKKYSKKA